MTKETETLNAQTQTHTLTYTHSSNKQDAKQTSCYSHIARKILFMNGRELQYFENLPTILP